MLRHEDVRTIAMDWQTFNSDAPFRVPISSEEEVRAVRRLPLEMDSPDHGACGETAEPIFQGRRIPPSSPAWRR